MDIQAMILNRLDQLIERGDVILSEDDEDNWYQKVGRAKTSALNLVIRFFGNDHLYTQEMNELIKKDIYIWGNFSKFVGILKAIKDDLENDGLINFKRLIEAEVFEDFLEQAEYLMNSHYYEPAAVIIGCVLEDGLRKLCIRNNIPLSERPMLGQMNDLLAKKGVYKAQTKKFITAFTDIRNKAAHGKWDEVEKEDVERFLDWTREFMEKHFS